MPWVETEESRSLRSVVERLGLDVSRLVPIHGEPVSWADFEAVEAPK